MSEENPTYGKKHRSLRKQQAEWEMKKNEPLQNMPDYTEKHKKEFVRQWAEEAASSAEEPSVDEQEPVFGSLDSETGMMPDDQHPVAVVEGEEDLALPDSKEIELEGAVEGGQVFPYHTGPTLIQGGNIVRGQRTVQGLLCGSPRLFSC